MLSEVLQDFHLLTVLPASFLILCTVFFVRKTGSKSYIRNEAKEKRIFSYRSEPLVEYSKINENLESTASSNENCQQCINLVKVNYLNLLNNTNLRNEAEFSIRRYGVGSCGPRGFYGTFDIHLTLENRLANFMEMEEAVLYSYGFSTISSAIAAYCKKSDIIFCDEKISFPATQGLLAAKSTVVYFKHNDTEDLETKLKECEKKERQSKKNFRKFLIVEALYKSTGKLCPLPKLIQLREKYKLRIFIDESTSFGVLGKNGRGITEHFNINRSDVDMIMASMEGAIGSVAGFCVGSAFIIDHQRLSGIGYVFSASLPPFLSHISICALEIFEKDLSLFSKLQSISVNVDQALRNMIEYLVVSDPLSPLKVITIRDTNNRLEKMKKIYFKCIEKKMLVILDEENIQFNVNIAMDQYDVDRIITTLKDVCV